MADDSSTQEKRVAKSTLFVRGLPYSATSKELEDFFGEIGPIRKCFVIADKQEKVDETDKSFKNKGIGYVHYALAEDAQQALAKLESTKFKNRLLKLEFARPRSEAIGKNKVAKSSPKIETPSKEDKEEKDDGPAVNRAARLIVRNLPWKYKENDLKKLFEKHGNVQDVKLPRKYEGGPLRGFSIIQYDTVKEAKAAMAALNATEHHGRTIAVDWCVSKDRFRQLEEDDKDDNEAASDKEEPSSNEDSADKDVEMAEVDSGSSSEEEEGEDDDDDEDEDEGHEGENMDTASDGEEEDESDAKETTPAKKGSEKKELMRPTPSKGTTLFIRNLLFESTEHDLKELFETHWGSVMYARIVKDPSTGLSRGTGFVCMHKKEDAEKCLEAAESLQRMAQKDEVDDATAMNQLLSKREKKKKGLTYQSILTPDAGSGTGLRFTLNGRVLDVSLAVERNEAQKIRDDRQSLRKKEDKRNLYLMREGVVFPDTPAAETMSPTELTKRQMSFSARKKQVSSNPSLYISKTRLSIRNLPIKVDEAELRKLGADCIQKFKEQVKAKTRTDLTKEEKEEGWHLKPRVKQAKIIRSKDRLDAATQTYRSKGYGFLEFLTHSHALAALRYLNNNPDVFDGKRLIVEFSLENKDVVERRKARNSDTPTNGKVDKSAKPHHKSDGPRKSEKPNNPRGFNSSRGGKRAGPNPSGMRQKRPAKPANSSKPDSRKKQRSK